MDHFGIVLFRIRNELTALGRVASFEACCQWPLLSVQITRLGTHYLTLKFTVQEYIYPPVSKVHAGSFCVSTKTLTWTTGSLMCVCDHSYACVYTQGWAHRQRVSTTFLTRKNTKMSCAPDGVRTLGHKIHWTLRLTLYQLSHHRVS